MDGLTDLLGGLGLDEIAGRPLDPRSVTVDPVPYTFGSPATGGLFRVAAAGAEGEWRAFVKVLQHLRHWPALQFMPPPVRESFLEFFPWREEVDMWRPAFVDRLPAGLRVPELHRLVELPDDRLAVWAEDVAVDESPWDDERFDRAAYLLAVHNARMADPEVLAACEHEPDYGMRMWVTHALRGQGLAPLADDALWAHPALVAGGDVRSGLQAWAPHVDEVLARLRPLRHGMPHGDASPQNLLVPADGSAEFVMIDVSFQTPAPLGSDLSQLVVGLAHAGLLPAARLPQVEQVVLEAYARGLEAEGLEPGADDVPLAYAATLLLRSGFTALPYEALERADPATVAARLDLTRFILGAADRHL
ncbi:aminoglycoside phosphotransferase [Spongisporangium articulatum]|uniref:Aminoglycoside phosphotransferase n=1 Tax=Spongisporangium articulatum TaxID=3362603 RepID=A0ABW8AQ16_9ACTN